jgi:hypothetical protein
MKLFLSLLILMSPLFAQSQAAVDWNEPTRGVSIALDKYNNVFTVDWDYNPAGDITLTKRDANGNFKWDAKFDNLDNTRHEVATWVAVDPQGNIIVTGTSRSGYSNPVNAASIVMKFNTAGTLLWRNVYENSFDGSYTKKCLIDGSGNIYVLGIGIGAAGQRTKVKKFSPTGSTLWTYLDSSGIGAPLNFKFTPDNNILIICRGITGNINGYSKISKSGNHKWSLTGVNSLTVGDAAGDAFGNTYVVSASTTVANSTALRKLNPAGGQIWLSNYPLTAFRVEVGNDNSPVACGFPNTGSGGSSFLKTDSSGAILWANPNADSTYNFLLHAQMMMDSYNNAYLAAGVLTGMAVCKVNSNGSSAWSIVTAGSNSSAFALGSDYNVYVVGGATARINQPAPCVSPGGNSTINITSTNAVLQWNFVPGADQYEVWYKKTTAINWRKRFVNSTNKKVTINNLICNTAYIWQVRTVCDTTGVDVTSPFSALTTFVTDPCTPRFSENETRNENNFDVYPNPANKEVYLTFEEKGEYNISIFDLSGKLMKAFTLNATDPGTPNQINISMLSPAIYILKVNDGSSTTSRKLVVID